MRPNQIAEIVERPDKACSRLSRTKTDKVMLSLDLAIETSCFKKRTQLK